MSKAGKVIAIANQKGGVGKTTTTINLSTALAATNKKVLVIDLDSQCNTTTGFGVQHGKHKQSIYENFVDIENSSASICDTEIPSLKIIPASRDLAALDIELSDVNEKEFFLKKIIQKIKDSANAPYDYIIIDCPPSLGMLTINALTASDEVIVPMQCEFYSLEGLSNLMFTIEKVKQNLNPNLKIAGILLTMYDRRSNLTQAVEEDVRKHLGNIVYNTTIPRNIRLSEAPSHGKPAIIYDHRCRGSIAYMLLTKEILSRE